MDFSPNSAWAYVLVGLLTSVTTIIVTVLNRKYGKKIKPSHSQQSGYTEWVAYLEREVEAIKKDNRRLAAEIETLKDAKYQQDALIGRMRTRLLELARKYDEDVSGVLS